MNGLHDTPAMKDSAKYSDFEYTMAIIPPNFGTHVGETALPVFGKPTPRQARLRPAGYAEAGCRPPHGVRRVSIVIMSICL